MQKHSFFSWWVLLGAQFLLAAPSLAQTCPQTAFTAKYWQYRERFNRHFIAIDRDSSGCIGDGIGQDTTDPCRCAGSGLSLPATSIVMSPEGSRGLGLRNHPTDRTFYDPRCGGPTSERDTTPSRVHNYLDMGSETPTQLGWYLVTLATEYELLGRNGQLEAQQRTLEEIFLAIQAVRRLDIRAQCLAADLYGSRHSVDSFLLCPTHYDADDGSHSSFNTARSVVCNFTPQTDGFSGFFIREDATQDLERLLHDPSEDRYNIDAVNSAYALSDTSLCEFDNFNQTCWIARNQGFMSQDQLFGLMAGLAFVKRYIPESARVTTCDGSSHAVLEPAQKITKALADRIDKEYQKRIAWPGSGSCCEEEVFLSWGEGGRLRYTMAGLDATAEYITGEDRRITNWERINYQFLAGQTVRGNTIRNANFFLYLTALGSDVGYNPVFTSWNIPPVVQPRHTAFNELCESYNKQIIPLMNNLLHPNPPNFQLPPASFEAMLCSAPCGGPCNLKRDDANFFGIHRQWPDFNCANTPGWVGQRWDGAGDNAVSRDQSWHSALYNGLDYMALHNIYLLNYAPNAVFQNPQNVQINNAGATSQPLFGSNMIQGPAALCVGQTGLYEISPLYFTATPHYQWAGTNNLGIASPTIASSNVTMRAALNPSLLTVRIEENRNITQHYNGSAEPSAYDSLFNPITFQTTNDECQITYHKAILSEVPVFSILPKMSPCERSFWAYANGFAPQGGAVTYQWLFRDLPSNRTLTCSEKACDFSSIVDVGPNSGAIQITLTVTTICGDTTISGIYSHNGCHSLGDFRQIKVSPNPTTNTIFVDVLNNGSLMPFDGNHVDLAIRPVNAFAAVKQARVDGNGQSINVSDLPDGVYVLQGVAPQWDQPVGTMFIIKRQ